MLRTGLCGSRTVKVANGTEYIWPMWWDPTGCGKWRCGGGGGGGGDSTRGINGVIMGRSVSSLK